MPRIETMADALRDSSRGLNTVLLIAPTLGETARARINSRMDANDTVLLETTVKAIEVIRGLKSMRRVFAEYAQMQLVEAEDFAAIDAAIEFVRETGLIPPEQHNG